MLIGEPHRNLAGDRRAVDADIGPPDLSCRSIICAPIKDTPRFRGMTPLWNEREACAGMRLERSYLLAQRRLRDVQDGAARVKLPMSTILMKACSRRVSRSQPFSDASPQNLARLVSPVASYQPLSSL